MKHNLTYVHRVARPARHAGCSDEFRGRDGDSPRARVDAPRAGFTLVEVSIAVLLLSIGLLGLIQVFAVSDRHTAYAREETVATSLAQEIREKIMSESFSDIVSIFDGVDTSDPSTVTLPAHDWAEHVAQHLGPTGRGVIQVDTPAENPSLPIGLLEVTVRISWHERGRQVELPLRFAVARTEP